MRGGLDQCDWTTRREIIRMLAERIRVEAEQVRVVYRISFPLFARRASKDSILHLLAA
jgi:hypothetical protein